jgi:hypothetical protein
MLTGIAADCVHVDNKSPPIAMVHVKVLDAKNLRIADRNGKWFILFSCSHVLLWNSFFRFMVIICGII